MIERIDPYSSYRQWDRERVEEGASNEEAPVGAEPGDEPKEMMMMI